MLKEIWTDDALSDVEEILDYLSANWNKKIIDRFYTDLTSALNQIKQNPLTFRHFDKAKGIRSCLPNRHFRLYYKVEGHGLYILRLYPNRKDPEGLYFR